MPPPVDVHDFYALLGLSPSASAQDITAGFKRELMKYHPDHAASTGLDVKACSARTACILEAYAVLHDATKRASYDASYRRRK